MGILGQGDEPGTTNVQVTVLVSYELGEDTATITCTKTPGDAGQSAFTVYDYTNQSSEVLWTLDVRPGDTITATCSISKGNTLSATFTIPKEEGQQVRAEGSYVGEQAELTNVVENTVWLEFNSAGGPGSVKGQGRWAKTYAEWWDCPDDIITFVFDYGGAYDPDTDAFSGTWDLHKVEEDWQGGPDEPCSKEIELTDLSGEWQGTLEGGIVRGSHPNWSFELTVLGQ